jgi:predicted RNase H-like HicB family nuclease
MCRPARWQASVKQPAWEGGWGAYLPDLPGVVALGATQEEVTRRLRQALNAYVEELGALGEQLPAPVAATGAGER